MGIGKIFLFFGLRLGVMRVGISVCFILVGFLRFRIVFDIYSC